MNELTINNDYIIRTRKKEGVYSHLLVYFEVIQINLTLIQYPNKKDYRGNLPNNCRIEGRIYWNKFDTGYFNNYWDVPETLSTCLCTNSWFGVTQEDIDEAAKWRERVNGAWD